MAQIFGRLREDKSTYGEKEVLKRLKANLPKEFSVYVECPIPNEREITHPDFIILTNYGFIILEVKDWKVIRKANSYSATIIIRGNKEIRQPNPVETSRDYAIDLINKIKRHKNQYNPRIDDHIPYGYAVVLTHVSSAQKTQLRRTWGNNFVMNLTDSRIRLHH